MGKGGCSARGNGPAYPGHGGPCREQRSSLYSGRSTGQSQPHSNPQDQKAGRRLSCCFLKFGDWSDFEVVGSASIYGGVHCMPSAVRGIEGIEMEDSDTVLALMGVWCGGGPGP